MNNINQIDTWILRLSKCINTAIDTNDINHYSFSIPKRFRAVHTDEFIEERISMLLDVSDDYNLIKEVLPNDLIFHLIKNADSSHYDEDDDPDDVPLGYIEEEGDESSEQLPQVPVVNIPVLPPLPNEHYELLQPI
jgi:hypothetical protein